MNCNDALDVRLTLPLDRFALDVTFSLTHHVTGIFGISGSGKTSLVESIAGLRQNVTGHVRLGQTTWLDSASGKHLPPERRDVGYVPQEGLLFPHMDVRSNLLAGKRRALYRETPVEQLFGTVVNLLGLRELLPRKVTTLSGGERQRVALGRALCSGPRILLLDEPLASLDISLRHRVLPFLRSVREQFDLPMLIVSHDPFELQALCDDLIVLRDGRIIARGEPRTVFTDPSVFPLAEKEGFKNVLPGRILRHAENTTVIGLSASDSGLQLVTPKSEQSEGDSVVTSIAAQDIILATERPHAISARNVFEAKVRSIRPLAHYRLVDVSLTPDVPDVVVELTPRAVEELAIVPGATVYVIIKTYACSVC